MQKLFRYGVSETMVVENETLKAIVVDCGAVETGGAVLAAINNLRHTDVEVTILRRGGQLKTIHSGHLDEVLTGLYAQSVEYELNKKGFGLGYRFMIDLKGTIALREGDKLMVRLDVGTTTFTSLDTGEAGSYVKAYTIPSNGLPSPVSVTRSHAVNNGNVDINMDLGDNVLKVVAAMDFTATYEASAKAKFAADIVITGNGGYKRSLPREAVEAENIYMFDDNPESDVAQLVIFKANQRLLHGAKLTGRLTAPADEFARIIVEHFENV